MEFYLADDILQGEDIPFYLLWDGDNPQTIMLRIDGFDSIKELHNVAESEEIEGVTVITKLHIPGYLGGIIATKNTDEPVTFGSLQVTIFSTKNREPVVFEERRALYTAKVVVKSVPHTLSIRNPADVEKIDIEIQGKATVLFEIKESDINECRIDVPPDVKEALEKVNESIKNGLIELKERFPKHAETIDLIIAFDESKKSITTYAEELEEKLQGAFEDEGFADALVTVLITSFLKQTSSLDRIIRPMEEYFASYSANKAYFSNPLLHVFPEGKECKLALRLTTTDLLRQECGSPVDITVPLTTCGITSIALKDLFSVRRLENGD